MGMALEWVLFPGGGFDWVDVSVQSLGAVAAGLLTITAPVSGVARWGWFLLGFGFVFLGGRLVGFI